jgi:hypothetical protein
MPRCRTCAFVLPDDPEHTGARCPHCRQALYQPPGRFPRTAGEGEGVCTVHSACVAVGTCGRCGNFLCETCHTRWDKRILCTACVDRALRGDEGLTDRPKDHARQAKIGLSAGVGAWILTAGFAAGMTLLSQTRQNPDALAAVGVLLLVTIVFPSMVIVALIGLGQSAAALRVRGDSMIVATLGLLLSGLHVGAMVGIMFFGIWVH